MKVTIVPFICGGCIMLKENTQVLYLRHECKFINSSGIATLPKNKKV